MLQNKTTNVSVPRANDKGVMESYLVSPEGSGPFPGVIVIHEIFGLNDHIRDVARQVAGQGYTALAVDLFSNRNRLVCMLQIVHGMMIRPLNNSILDDLKSSVAFLQGQPNVDAIRIGAVGFCLGGTYALQLAITDKGMKAASVFYGGNPKPLETVVEACPIVGSYPDKDFTTKAARELETSLTNYNVPHDIKIYDNTQHSFFSQNRTATEAHASGDAWQRMLSFFHKHLK
jgi:carboxymethylenebutenolidase